MSRIQRVRSFFMGLGMILCCVLLQIHAEIGYPLAALFVLCSLLFYGVKMLLFYHIMARHMVGGKAMLFLSILVLDFGLFILTVVDTPEVFIIIHLVLYHSFSGVTSLLKARDTRLLRAALGDYVSGFLNLGIVAAAVLCALLLRSNKLLLLLYCAGLFYSACVHIVNALRNTAIVYIP